jgi:hypothetical protein
MLARRGLRTSSRFVGRSGVPMNALEENFTGRSECLTSQPCFREVVDVPDARCVEMREEKEEESAKSGTSERAGT